MTGTLKGGNVLHNFGDLQRFVNVHEHEHAKQISETQFQERAPRGVAREHAEMGGELFSKESRESAQAYLDSVGSTLEMADDDAPSM